MTEKEQFEQIDAYDGKRMIVFSDRGIALRYVAHRRLQGYTGVLAMCEDTRTGSGLCVLWRDPVKPHELLEREANCRWLLEQTLAGRSPKPVAGKVNELWSGGFQK